MEVLIYFNEKLNCILTNKISKRNGCLRRRKHRTHVWNISYIFYVLHIFHILYRFNICYRRACLLCIAHPISVYIIYYSPMIPSDMMSSPSVDYFINDVTHCMTIPSINRVLWIVSNISYRTPISFI